MSQHPGERVHLELRRNTFVLYTDHAAERIELPYEDADEVVAHLTRVLTSEHYQRSATLPARRSPTGHILSDTPQKLKPTSEGRRKLHPICDQCGNKITNPLFQRLSQAEFATFLCEEHYRIARNNLYPDK